MRTFRIKLREDNKYQDFEILVQAKDFDSAEKKALVLWKRCPEKFEHVLHVTAYDDDET